jgi:hypothetical protein
VGRIQNLIGNLYQDVQTSICVSRNILDVKLSAIGFQVKELGKAKLLDLKKKTILIILFLFLEKYFDKTQTAES